MSINVNNIDKLKESRKKRERNDYKQYSLIMRTIFIKTIFTAYFAHLDDTLPFSLREKTQHMFPDKNRIVSKSQLYVKTHYENPGGRTVVPRRDFLCEYLLLDSLLVPATVRILSTARYICRSYIFALIV